MNDTLKAFRAKFEHKLKTLREDFENRIKEMREFNREECRNADTRLNNLEDAINQEISDRVTETDEKIGETQDILTCKFNCN